MVNSVLCSLYIFFLGFPIMCHAMWTQEDCLSKHDKIYVAGHNGLVGAAIVRALIAEGFDSIVTCSHADLDLRDQQKVNTFFEHVRPDYVILAAARVGGIKANMDNPAQFIYDNIMITANVIHAAYLNSVKKLMFLGSSCIYPRDCPQPIKEEYLLAGSLEQTNEPYAIAKIAGLKMCQAYNRQYGTRFISCMPTNLYGLHDNFDLTTSHVMPALIAKICQAQKEGRPSIAVWGTGQPRREFLYVDDLADAVLFLMRHYQGNDPVNIGTGADIPIAELAMLIQLIAGYSGKISFDHMHPEGTPRKLLDVSALRQHGWRARISLEEGVRKTVEWYRQNCLS